MRCANDRAFSFLLIALLGSAATAVAQSTTRASVAGSGAELATGGLWGAISGDGRFVAFVTDEPALPGDTNNTSDVYVRELATGVLRRVSLTAAGVQPNGPCFQPKLSDDGRYIAFTSWASNLAPSDTNGTLTDVFVKDMVTGALQHVSVNSAGVGGNHISAYEDLSGDGRFVTYYSNATNLVPNDTNGQQDTFLFDRTTGQTVCLSIDPASGAPAGGGEASLSDDGRYVAFETWAPLFGAAASTIALLDRQTGTYTCVPMIGAQVMYAVAPKVSGDGSTVLFESAFSFAPADTDFAVDVYAFDVATGTRRLVSVPPTPGLTAPCHVGACSRNARYVAYSTSDAYVAADTNGVSDSYVVDTVTGALELVTRGNAGQIGNEAAYVRGMSDDGRRCEFGSLANNFVVGDTNAALDVFVRDRAVAASWIAYGSGLPGTGGVVPGIALLGDPAIGTAPSLVVANHTGAPAATLVVLGLQPASLPTPVLGTLLVQPAATSLLVAPSPALLLPVPIPNVFELCGLHLYLQALVIDAGAPAGVAFTRGIDATIGG